MNIRRLSLAVVVFLVVAVAVAFAQPEVTVVLTNGQRYTGTLAYQNNSVSLNTDDGGQMSWPARDVAVIEFEPGQPSQQELSSISNTSSAIPSFLRSAISAVALRNGQVLEGRLTSISPDGNQVTVATTSGSQTFSANDIARLYLNPSSARNLYASNASQTQSSASPAVGTSGVQLTSQETTIKVPGNQPWTDTGITVSQGEAVSFSASGQVTWIAGRPPVGPDGTMVNSHWEGRYPIRSRGVGALIGRIGPSGQPFAIGSNASITMPASGELYLGINDSDFSDNGGGYTVQMARASAG